MKHSSIANHLATRPFQRLLNNKRKAVHYRPKMANFLIACANQEHQAVATLIQYWIEPSQTVK